MSTPNPGRAAIQDLLYVSKIQDGLYNITYTDGGTAGSEVVTVTDNDINVLIASNSSTAAQIKTAIEAHPVAKDLVTVSVIGTAGTAQVSTVLSAIAGGKTAAYASVVLDHMKYQAKASGGNGNLLKVRQRKGAANNSLAVSASLSGIAGLLDVTIALSGSPLNSIIDAIKANVTASGLFDPMTDGVSANYISTFSNPSYIALTGGQDAVAPSGIAQGILIKGKNSGTTLNTSTLTYDIGGTAGSESVVTGSGQIEVLIENGVSTAQQVINALNSSAAFTPYYSGLVAAGGNASTAQKVVHTIAMSGMGNDPNMIGLYQETDANALLSQTYVYRPFGFAATRLSIDNFGSTGDVCVSLDGTKDAVICEATKSTETVLDYKPGVYLKYRTANPNFNLRAEA